MMITIWDKIEHGLNKLSVQRYHRRVDLNKILIAVIIQAAKDKDVCYFGTDEFLYHCHLVGINSDYISNIVERAWRTFSKQQKEEGGKNEVSM